MTDRLVEVSVPALNLLLSYGPRAVTGDVTSLPPPNHPLPDGAQPVAAYMVFDRTYAQPIEGVQVVAPAGQVGGVATPPASVAAVASPTAIAVTPVAGAVVPQAWILGLEGVGYLRRVYTIDDSASFDDVPAGLEVTPTARAVVDSVVSVEVRGTPVRLVAPLSITGTLVFTTGAEATEGETLAWTGLTITGGSVVARRWTDDGTVISGQVGDTLLTTGRLGVIALQLTIQGEDGSTVLRTTSTTVTAAPATPSAPLALRVGTTTLDGLPLAVNAPVSAGSSAITQYEWTVARAVGGAPLVFTSAGLSVLATGLGGFNTPLTVTVRAQNAQGWGPASAPLVIQYFAALTGFLDELSGVTQAWIALSDNDRTWGVARVFNSRTAGVTATLRDNTGVQMAVLAGIASSNLVLTTQRGLHLAATAAATVTVTPYIYSNGNAGVFSAPVVAQGGTVTVTQPTTYVDGAGIEARYALAWYASATSPAAASIEPWTTSLTHTIPAGHQGQWVGMIAMAYDTLRGLLLGGSSMSHTSGATTVGPIGAAGLSVTITNNTDLYGEQVLLSAIPGYTAAKGVRITVTAATDGAQVGGWYVSYQADGQAADTAVPVAIYGPLAVGAQLDIAPLPTDANASGQAQLRIGTGQGGTWSYTLSITAIP